MGLASHRLASGQRRPPASTPMYVRSTIRDTRIARSAIAEASDT